MIGTRHQIRLEQWGTSKDAKGNNVESKVQVLNTWAEISRSGGDTSSLNGQAGLTNFFIFRVRFASSGSLDLNGTWRVIYDRRDFKVHSIEKENQKRFYWIIKAEAMGAR